MNPADFKAPQAGRVVKTAQGYAAFVPAPLPPQLDYSEALVLALSAADAALSELSGLGRVLPNPRLLIAPYVRREAVLSSRIEGTQASLSDLLVDEAGQPTETPADDVQEVRNYVVALEYGIERLTDLPLSLRLVGELHARLMAGVRGQHATPGEFRRSQNWIGPPGSTPVTAPYVPPPVAEMKEALGEWEKFLHQRGTMPELIQCALMHEHFEALHPFLDGNGRVGRLLITLFLIERGRLSQPLLYLSEFIERYKADYYFHLQAVRTHGDWQGWLLYFLNGVRWSASRAIRQASQLIDLRESMRQRLAAIPKALPLVDALFENPYFVPLRVVQLTGVSDPTARTLLRKLTAAGVLREVTGRQWGKLYVAQDVLKAMAEPGEDPNEIE
ncbi:Fic family protein [Sinimarinibacterium sp. CAU 1509]|nr:Fic family protein [Sinimarinibacterium sp. CAU 1509]